MAAVPSPYVLLLNNDVELAPDYLEKLVKTLEADETLGFATGKLLRATDRTRLDGAGDAMLLAGASYRLGHLDPDQGNSTSLCPCLPRAAPRCSIVPRHFCSAARSTPTSLPTSMTSTSLCARTSSGTAACMFPMRSPTTSAVPRWGRPCIRAWSSTLRATRCIVLIKDYPRPLSLRLLPRILVYQALWFLFALKSAGLGPYVRGLRGALRGRKRMKQKHRELMAKRQINDAQLLALMQMSERQVYDWHRSRSKGERSSLLTLYFRLFAPRHDSRAALRRRIRQAIL